ncbi:hypothetical protein ACEQ8H_001078 [Pleosporales sp. CAS-2024a]
MNLGPTDDDEEEAKIQREMRESNRFPSLETARRSRRCRPRVSYTYIDPLVDAFSDQDPVMDSRSAKLDACISDASTSESAPDGEFDLEDLDDERSSSIEDSSPIEDEQVASVSEPRTEPRTKPRATHTSNAVSEGKGIDLTLPPIDNVQDAFADMAAVAVQLGLDVALKGLSGRRINVATMCSGTESPLLAFELLSSALVAAGYPALNVNQKFAAEIEVFKQAFIERNQSPDIIFRDVREFIPDDADTAVTAYGAEVPIPSDLDMLIAGFVCKDLSRLNTQQKGLEEKGESGDTWRAMYSYAKRFRPSIVLIENVKGLSKLWDGVVDLWDQIGYEATWLIRDTKRYRIPQTRERMYMIAIERRKFGKGVKQAMFKWEGLMDKLQRQCSSPYEAWLKSMLHEPSQHSALTSEVDWALCKLRYDHIRSDERLGILRPVTNWNESGTVRPPDFANRPWYRSQSSRVYDAIDVAYLQEAQKGQDSLYKMAVFDVSQNVDRFKSSLGIIPCITPGGSDFATNRQVALDGKQLLLLQGMPLDKLLFGTETQKECQDLAGNAMTTTVIGASIIAAIVSGWRAFRSQSSDPELKDPHRVSSAGLVRTRPMKSSQLASNDIMQLDVSELQHDAIMSARLCNCEGQKVISKFSIRVCSSCEHTACEQCAGNPKHRYNESLLHSDRMQTPNDFVQKWKPELAIRFRFGNFTGLDRLQSALKLPYEIATEFLNHVTEVASQSTIFSFENLLRRHNGWAVNYTSANATLELRVGSYVEWLLFIVCPARLPGNHALRNLFKYPIARAKARTSLLDLQWKICVPSLQTCDLKIAGTDARTSSWRSRIGLLDYKSETVPLRLRVGSRSTASKKVLGDYELLPHCGTASNSLYKRTTSPPLYLFLDPDLLGCSNNDSFVFSEDCSRKSYGDNRIILASLDASWRPWLVTDQAKFDVEATIHANWISTDMYLEPVETTLTVAIPEDMAAISNILDNCLQPITMLEVRVPEHLTDLSIDKHSWILERAKRLPAMSTWQPGDAGSFKDCTCAPVYPRLLWSVDSKGIATAHESRKAAAAFERAVKTRASIFHTDMVVEGSCSRLLVSVNIQALMHRAMGRLAHADPIDIAWRLLTDHAELPVEPFFKFYLLSNVQDPPLKLSPAVSYLRNTQPRALSWMKAQEMGKSITITEVEEAVNIRLGWRAEARAQFKVSVRGGVLADLPSFGKTVTTIALIQSEFEEQPPETLLKSNQQLNERLGASALLNTAATLVVCPSHIALQWRTELEKFLGKKFAKYNVIVIQSFAELQKLRIDDFRRSRVVVLAWSVLAEEDYIAHLAHFTAMPEPNISGRRAFDTWFDQASRHIPHQLKTLRESKFDEFNESVKCLLQERLQHEDFKAIVPIRIQHGSAYQSFNAMKAKLEAKCGGGQGMAKGTKVTTSHQVPLLHLFRFNRVVVDEYHYLNDDKKISNILASVGVKRIAALKRWVLSGTPALSNFSDVDQIASYLGIRLGRYHCGDSVVTSPSDKVRRGEQTQVEEFLCQTENMSRQWHAARHERGQEFLNRFVRQNEPSLAHIACSESIKPSEIDIGHMAVYLELLQYVASHGMAIRKLKSKTKSDKVDRLNASLSKSANAEDALLKCAMVFRSSEGKSALEDVHEMRSSQRKSVETELKALMSGFEGMDQTEEMSDLYDGFVKDISELKWLGDEDANRVARNMLLQARRAPRHAAFPELKGVVAGVHKSRLLKKRLSTLRETARDLVQLIRAERFIKAIIGLVEPLARREDGQSFRCNGPDCHGMASLSELHLDTNCGHTACANCLFSRTNADRCVDPTCNMFSQGVHLVKVTDLGSRCEPATQNYFGRKMEDVIGIVSTFPRGDQGVIFAPNDETVELVEQVLDCHSVSYYSLRGCRGVMSAKMIEKFQASRDADDAAQVLVLNMGSESAAGANLVNANHVIFVAPLLAKTQYEYDSAMAQAIARLRRYGQSKTVHIYHVIAQRTIDVDIMEHRHKRADGITTSCMPMKMPKALKVKEKTKLVRNKRGQMALVPVSWLADETTRTMMGVEENPESFASLVAFSSHFQHDED